MRNHTGSVGFLLRRRRLVVCVGRCIPVQKVLPAGGGPESGWVVRRAALRQHFHHCGEGGLEEESAGVTGLAAGHHPVQRAAEQPVAPPLQHVTWQKQGGMSGEPAGVRRCGLHPPTNRNLSTLRPTCKTMRYVSPYPHELEYFMCHGTVLSFSSALGNGLRPALNCTD